MHTNLSRMRRVTLAGAVLALLVTACAPSDPTTGTGTGTGATPSPLAQKTTQPDEDPANFDLDALIAAART